MWQWMRKKSPSFYTVLCLSFIYNILPRITHIVASSSEKEPSSSQQCQPSVIRRSCVSWGGKKPPTFYTRQKPSKNIEKKSSQRAEKAWKALSIKSFHMTMMSFCVDDVLHIQSWDLIFFSWQSVQRDVLKSRTKPLNSSKGGKKFGRDFFSH